jgi:hypothetical protein
VKKDEGASSSKKETSKKKVASSPPEKPPQKLSPYKKVAKPKDNSILLETSAQIDKILGSTKPKSKKK